MQLDVNEGIRKDFIWGLEVLGHSKKVFLSFTNLWLGMWGTLRSRSIVMLVPRACVSGSQTLTSHSIRRLQWWRIRISSSISRPYVSCQPFTTPTVVLDNPNTVDIFKSFRALPTYNALLKAAVDILISGGHELRVHYVRGDENVVADAVSRADFNRARAIVPSLKLATFSP